MFTMLTCASRFPVCKVRLSLGLNSSHPCAIKMPYRTTAGFVTAALWVQLLSLEKNEQVAAMLPVDEFSEDDFVVMLTRCGFLKRTPLKPSRAFSKMAR